MKRFRQIVKIWIASPVSLLALLVWIVLFSTALLADFLANDKPILMYENGNLRFPIFENKPLVYPLKLDEGSIMIWPLVRHGIRVNDTSYPHPLGVDRIGRDVAAGIIHGSRISLLVGFGALIPTLFLACSLGIYAGYYGNSRYVNLDRKYKRGYFMASLIRSMMELIDTLPKLFVFLAVAYTFYQTNLAESVPYEVRLIVLIMALGWTTTARWVMAETMKISEMEYVLAVKSLGIRHMRIMFAHIFPNIAPRLWVAAGLSVGSTIMLEATLSFLGLGDPERVSWGSLLRYNSSSDLYSTGFYPLLWPTCVIALVIFASVHLAEKAAPAYKNVHTGFADPKI